MPVAEILTASAFQDQRGMLNAFAGFDLKPIVRMYAIEPATPTSSALGKGISKSASGFMPLVEAMKFKPSPSIHLVSQITVNDRSGC